MHAPSVISLLVSGLAASTVAGFELNTPGASLSRRSVALIAAAAGPALALPAHISIEARHHQGKKKNKANTRDVEETSDLEKRKPHHQGKGGKKKNKSGANN
ncbi:hypothetical protein DHEL01_v200130 [Diaporthe helianthi]|uniref:Uncharacterized protein n=1 Tax=Diaporthe helianthi TaxID=158607 RepID=A0A2P5IG36_DIAHE|nr:hypothetical protein DHEL01_v200130 [Diaporthe helianthi]